MDTRSFLINIFVCTADLPIAMNSWDDRDEPDAFPKQNAKMCYNHVNADGAIHESPFSVPSQYAPSASWAMVLTS